MAALSPTSTEARPNSREAATAPSTTTAGPKSPPIASTAIFMRGRPAGGQVVRKRSRRPPPRLLPGRRSASRRTAVGWAPRVRGEQSGKASRRTAVGWAPRVRGEQSGKASRRTAVGWAPRVRGERSGACAGKAGRCRRTSCTPTDLLVAFDRDDLSPLVEPAVGADLMGWLGLAALGAGGPGRRRHLVVRPALAPAGLGMTSFGQGHRLTPILLRGLSRQALGPCLERRPPGIGDAYLTVAGDHVPVATTDRAETAAVLTTERFHREQQRRLRLEERGE